MNYYNGKGTNVHSLQNELFTLEIYNFFKNIYFILSNNN